MILSVSLKKLYPLVVVGDNKINCHNAREIGHSIMSKMTHQTFKSNKLKSSDKVLPLLNIISTIIVLDEKVPIEHVLLFQQMSVTKTFEEDITIFLLRTVT